MPGEGFLSVLHYDEFSKVSEREPEFSGKHVEDLVSFGYGFHRLWLFRGYHLLGLRFQFLHYSLAELFDVGVDGVEQAFVLGYLVADFGGVVLHLAYQGVGSRHELPPFDGGSEYGEHGNGGEDCPEDHSPGYEHDERMVSVQERLWFRFGKVFDASLEGFVGFLVGDRFVAVNSFS